MSLRLEDLSMPEPQSEAGQPMLLPLADIDEDPLQPRAEFDAATLRELADTIASRGVRQPISVRRHPEAPGRWMLNFGARRLRASALAGLDTIPAFLDGTADSYDQVIENEQREGLNPMELALFVKKRLAAGESHQDIARRLGKSKSRITMLCALIDPPDWLLSAYRSGRCCGVTELYELRRMQEKRPAEVDAILAGGEPMNRAAIRSLGARPIRSAPVAVAPAALADRPATEASATRKVGVDPAPILKEADRLVTALETTIDQLKFAAPERLSGVRDRIVALASR